VPDDVIIASGYGWAVFMMVLGVTNLVVALTASFSTWAWFVSVGLLGAKIAAFFVQYIVFRVAAERRAARAAAPSP
jgi:intracellular septation protein